MIIYLHIYLSISVFVYSCLLLVRLSVFCLSIYLQTTYPSICLSIYLSIYPSPSVFCWQKQIMQKQQNILGANKQYKNNKSHKLQQGCALSGQDCSFTAVLGRRLVLIQSLLKNFAHVFSVLSINLYLLYIFNIFH